jgi:hypothetical protein
MWFFCCWEVVGGEVDERGDEEKMIFGIHTSECDQALTGGPLEDKNNQQPKKTCWEERMVKQ